MFRKGGAAILATALSFSSVTAFAGTESQFPKPSASDAQKPQSATDSGNPEAQRLPSLGPGAVAGVQKAQSFSGPSTPSWLIGASIVIGGVVLIASDHNQNHSTGTSASPR